MKVVIVGAGQVGYQIADRLSREGHDIALIERSAEKVRALESKLNALVVEGIAASAKVLEEVEVQDADLFIAVTDVDEVNLVSCMLANEYGVPTIISRIRNIEYAGAEWAANAKKLGIDLLINPQMVVAKEIVRVITYPVATSVAEFADGRIVFLGYRIGSDNPLAGITLKELGDLCGMYRLVVAALSRQQKTVVPHGQDVILRGHSLLPVPEEGAAGDQLPLWLWGAAHEKHHDPRRRLGRRRSGPGAGSAETPGEDPRPKPRPLRASGSTSRRRGGDPR